MIVSLGLYNYRLHANTSLQHLPRLIFLVGDTGTGKSTLLDAIKFAQSLASGRSAVELVKERGGEAGMVSFANLRGFGETRRARSTHISLILETLDPYDPALPQRKKHIYLIKIVWEGGTFVVEETLSEIVSSTERPQPRAKTLSISEKDVPLATRLRDTDEESYAALRFLLPSGGALQMTENIERGVYPADQICLRETLHAEVQADREVQKIATIYQPDSLFYAEPEEVVFFRREYSEGKPFAIVRKISDLPRVMEDYNGNRPVSEIWRSSGFNFPQNAKS
jgi:energy-coupling factor transporter ATP-binding protein EcfA2